MFLFFLRLTFFHFFFSVFIESYCVTRLSTCKLGFFFFMFHFLFFALAFCLLRLSHVLFLYIVIVYSYPILSLFRFASFLMLSLLLFPFFFSFFFFTVVVVVLSGFDRLTFLMSFFRCSLSCRCSTEVAFHLFFPCFMLDHCAKAHFLKTKSNFFFRGRLKKWCLNNVLATRSVRCWRVQTLVWVVIICFSPLPFAIIFSSLFFFFCCLFVCLLIFDG